MIDFARYSNEWLKAIVIHQEMLMKDWKLSPVDDLWGRCPWPEKICSHVWKDRYVNAGVGLRAEANCPSKLFSYAADR